MHFLQYGFSLNSQNVEKLSIIHKKYQKFLLTLYKQGGIIAPERRKEDKKMVTMTFADSIGMLVADYDKYSNKMILEGKEPVSLIKYSLGNF